MNKQPKLLDIVRNKIRLKHYFDKRVQGFQGSKIRGLAF